LKSVLLDIEYGKVEEVEGWDARFGNWTREEVLQPRTILHCTKLSRLHKYSYHMIRPYNYVYVRIFIFDHVSFLLCKTQFLAKPFLIDESYSDIEVAALTRSLLWRSNNF
jgi:hypothetical protein